MRPQVPCASTSTPTRTGLLIELNEIQTDPIGVRPCRTRRPLPTMSRTSNYGALIFNGAPSSCFLMQLIVENMCMLVFHTCTLVFTTCMLVFHMKKVVFTKYLHVFTMLQVVSLHVLMFSTISICVINKPDHT